MLKPVLKPIGMGLLRLGAVFLRVGSALMRAGAALVRIGIVVVLAAGSAQLGCRAHSDVVRLVDGRHVQGPYVPEEAYAAYLEATKLETQGDWQAAARAYAIALESDSDGIELWTRLGAVRCRSEPSKSRTLHPWEAFQRAEAISRSYEPLWTERATCHLWRGDPASALGAAQTAISLDPNRIEPVLVLVDAMERLGRIDEARRWMDGLVLRTPVRDVFKAMVGFAKRTRDKAREQEASQTLERHWPERQRLPTLRPDTEQLDEALLLGQYTQALKIATVLRLPSAELALRAASVGRAEWAREQAETVMRADPTNSDARIAAAVAADLLRNRADFETVLSSLPASMSAPSLLGVAMLEQLVARRIGPQAGISIAREAKPSPDRKR